MIANTKEISKTSVWNILHEKGYSYQTAVEIPKLTKEQKLARKIHCEEWKDKDLSSIIFLDESYFHLFRNTLEVWTKEKKSYIERINPNKALIVWADISKKGKSEICVNEWGYRLNQDGYIEIF